MDSFAPEDILRYYKYSYIRSPANPKQIVQVWNVNGGTKQVQLCPLGNENTGEGTFMISQDDVKWEHVKIPRLGYRVLKGGKCLYYVTKIVGRNITKALNPQTINVEIDNRLASILAKLDHGVYHSYVNGNGIQREGLVAELFTPTFMNIKQASNNLMNAPKTNRIAEALNHDFALVLGKNADKVLTLLFKGFTQVAHSKDGDRWSLVNDEYRDVIKRGLGELNYV